MKYMLDTDSCIYLINARSQSMLNKIQQKNFGEVGISSISYAELNYGVAKSTQQKQNQIALLHFATSLVIDDFDDNAAIEYGEIRANLEKKGTPIGPLDCLIAAHAKSLGSTVVTNNEREFKRVPGLKVENWCH